MTDQPTPTVTPEAAAAGSQPPAAKLPAAAEPKPYEEVITDEAITQPGLITIHKVGPHWYFELPADSLGVDMLWYAEFGDSPAGVALQPRALGTRYVRWERYENSILVRDRTDTLRLRPAFDVRDEAQRQAEQRYIESVALPSILYSFPVVAEGEDGSAVIDVTLFLITNQLEFDASGVLKAVGYQAVVADPLRSRVEQITGGPDHLLIHTLLTFKLTAGPSNAATLGIVHTLLRLPDPPMKPRYVDPRVGYFTTEFGVVSQEDDPGIVQRQIISRYRLEKSDPDAEVSDPVQPIIFYLPPEIPAKWRPYVRQGVEDWQPAFESAGFSNAIIALDAPSLDEDPNWDPADARYSVIRWVPQPFPNAMGPHLADPRTGEILSAHILFWDDVLKIAQQWYFTQVSAVDERAQKLPLPDEILGEVIRYIVCHEVGHSIGLRHNHRASQAYTTEQLRDPAFADERGPVASIMSYGRLNYVAQPGDGVSRMLPRLGPYDYFAINWGYRPIPEADTPDAETPTLNEWAAIVKDNVELQFGGEDATAKFDPTVLTENIGDDRIESAALGIANLERMLAFLVPATTRERGGYDLLYEMYRAILANRTTWLVSAAKELGGVVERRTLDPELEAYERVPAERQRQIAAFLLDNLRQAGPFLRPDIVNRILPYNAIKPVMDSQNRVLDSMLAGVVYKQFEDAVILEPEKAYPVAEYLADVQSGLFVELREDHPAIDPIMRSAQRHYLTTMKNLLAAYESKPDAMLTQMLGAMGMPPELVEMLMTSGQGTDFRNAARTVLRELHGELHAALERVSELTTKAHLEDLAQEVEEILVMVRPTPPPARPF